MESALSAIVSGLPLSAIDCLSDALEQSYGEGVVGIVILNKDNLRHRVRLSSKSIKDVLVVLDSTSSDMCKDIENGLYSSDRYYTYTSDCEFVSFLNSKYGLSIELPHEVEQVSYEVSGVSENSLQYDQCLLDAEKVIANLQEQIAILEETNDKLRVEEREVNSSKLEEFELDLLSAKNSLQEKISELESVNSELSELKSQRELLENSMKNLEKSKNSLLDDYTSISSEVTELKVVNSRQSGVIRSKDKEISELRAEITSFDGIKKKVALLEEDKKSLLTELSLYKSKISNLSNELKTKASEIDSLSKQLKAEGVKDKIVDELNKRVATLQNEKSTLEKQLEKKTLEVTEVFEKASGDSTTIQELKKKVSELEEKDAVSNESLTQLNIEKIQLQEKVRLLQKTSNSDGTEELAKELSDLRKEYNSLRESVFGRISAYALPNASTRVQLVESMHKLSNIRFVFAGSTESRKGAYRCLLQEFRGSNDRILIVDVVSETSIDYVFEVKRVVNGLEWFTRGGGVQRYLSSTCEKNIQVLSPGLGYLNDSYFLTVDWLKRLEELDNSGYKVVVFCGDLSNIVGRVLHESFADFGSSIIYVHGNAIGSRSIVSNLRGISNGKSSIVAYFDYNRQLKKFYDLVSKTNECRILSFSR